MCREPEREAASEASVEWEGAFEGVEEVSQLCVRLGLVGGSGRALGLSRPRLTPLRGAGMSRSAAGAPRHGSASAASRRAMVSGCTCQDGARTREHASEEWQRRGSSPVAAAHRGTGPRREVGVVLQDQRDATASGRAGWISLATGEPQQQRPRRGEQRRGAARDVAAVPAKAQPVEDRWRSQ